MDTTEKQYLTINRSYPDIFEIEEKKSRFICHIHHVRSETAASEKINEISSSHRDASHNCYAYVLFNDNSPIKKFSDNNEPKGTAGMPILKVIESNDLYNILVVITRYFGGTLLGAGGLTRAYTKAAAKGVELLPRIYLKETNEVIVCVDYHDYGRVENVLNEEAVKIMDIAFGEKVGFTFISLIEHTSALVNIIENITSARAQIRIEDKVFREVTL